MQDASLTGLLGDVTENVTAHEVWGLVPRMLAAVVIGLVLSLRPWRWPMHRARPKAEMIHTQVLLCAAAAVITAVIGDSVAKAFGLVGLGGFVRFRSGLKDPRDAAILFLMIGLGMACGHGSLRLAGVGAAFVALLLLALDLAQPEEQQAKSRMLVSAQADDLVGAEASLRKALGERNVLVKSCALDFAGRRLELEVEAQEAGDLSAALGQPLAVRGVRWSTLTDKGARGEAT